MASWRPRQGAARGAQLGYSGYRVLKRLVASTLLQFVLVMPQMGQQPFYTDDPAVTERGKWHFEFFNEFDLLQRPQFPNVRQNTANYKLNYGLPYDIEVDFDSPYLAIFRALGSSPGTSSGIGDTNLGLKWNFHKEVPTSRLPAMSLTLYFEFPTGDINQQLGSGLTDYWLNFIAQKHVSEKIRITVNMGILFAGNTSTGVLGIQNRRGRVYTGGLSVLRDFSSKWTLGAEVYGGLTSQVELSKSQFQILTGGKYALRKGLTLDFGVLGGKYVASPRIGGQIGVSVDFPTVFR
jgi:hypothetical protein